MDIPNLNFILILLRNDYVFKSTFLVLDLFFTSQRVKISIKLKWLCVVEIILVTMPKSSKIFPATLDLFI